MNISNIPYIKYVRVIEENRLESIKRAYPGFASKYALLLGTGLPHRQILERMIIDYSRDERENAKCLKL